MSYSPFAVEFERDTPWVLWENRTPVLVLLEKPTESLREYEPIHQSEQAAQMAVSQSAGIERRQYMAILNRMHQASGRAGTFSNWNTVQT